jgi:thioredoxin-like negative regulator of GroEL
MAEKYSGQIQFISVDVDRCPEVANAFEVQSIPFILFVSPDGKIDSHVGMMEEADFDAKLQNLL